jgi:hypothetical protein
MPSKLFGFHISRLERLPLRPKIGLCLLERRCVAFGANTTACGAHRCYRPEPSQLRPRRCEVLVGATDLDSIFVDRSVAAVGIARQSGGTQCEHAGDPASASRGGTKPQEPDLRDLRGLLSVRGYRQSGVVAPDPARRPEHRSRPSIFWAGYTTNMFEFEFATRKGRDPSRAACALRPGRPRALANQSCPKRGKRRPPRTDAA